MTDTDPYLVSVVTHRPAYGRYGYAARAATPSGLSRFASSCQHRIAIACVAIAIFALVYFAAELLRGVL